MGPKFRDIIIFLIMIVVIIGLLHYFGVIDLRVIYAWLYNVLIGY